MLPSLCSLPRLRRRSAVPFGRYLLRQPPGTWPLPRPAGGAVPYSVRPRPARHSRACRRSLFPPDWEWSSFRVQESSSPATCPAALPIPLDGRGRVVPVPWPLPRTADGYSRNSYAAFGVSDAVGACKLMGTRFRIRSASVRGQQADTGPRCLPVRSRVSDSVGPVPAMPPTFYYELTLTAPHRALWSVWAGIAPRSLALALDWRVLLQALISSHWVVRSLSAGLFLAWPFCTPIVHTLDTTWTPRGRTCILIFVHRSAGVSRESTHLQLSRSWRS